MYTIIIMKISIKIILAVTFIMLLFGWLLFRPSADKTRQNDSRIGTILTFDVPMIYITNCSQCSLSSRAQKINTFLVPQTFLYDSTGFLDKNSIVTQADKNDQFTIQEIFTNYPHGLETAFRDKITYLVVTNQQGLKSVVYENVSSIIKSDKKNTTKETVVKTQLLDDVKNLDVFWISIKLNNHMLGDFSDAMLPDDVVKRKKLVSDIENEFINKIPKDQILQYELDPYHPTIYLKLSKKDTLLYIQSEQAKLNIISISLHEGDDPIFSQQPPKPHSP